MMHLRLTTLLIATIAISGAGCGDDSPRSRLDMDPFSRDLGTVDGGIPVCEGARPACSTFDVDSCDSIAGCGTAICDGRPFSCFRHDNFSTCYDAGCDWDGAFSLCEGTPAPCSRRSERFLCQDVGCDWVAGSECAGSRIPCETLDRSDCVAADGCNLIGEPGIDGGVRDAGRLNPDLGDDVDMGSVDRSWPETMCPSGECDLRTSEGCEASESCVLSTSSQPLCAAEGSLLMGEECDRHDDCLSGHLCILQTTDVAFCRRVCCGDNAAHCSDATVCRGIGGIENLGACLPTCSLLAQDCPESAGCYGNAGPGMGTCSAAGSGDQDAACDAPRDCLPGYTCIAFDSGSTCAEYCDRTAPACSDDTLDCLSLAGETTLGYCG